MIASVKAERDAYTAYAEHGSATVNVGVRIATALPGPLVPDAPDLPAGYRPREADIAALKSLLISGDGNTGIVGRARAAGLRGMGGLGKTVPGNRTGTGSGCTERIPVWRRLAQLRPRSRRSDLTQCAGPRGNWPAAQLHNGG